MLLAAPILLLAPSPVPAPQTRDFVVESTQRWADSRSVGDGGFLFAGASVQDATWVQYPDAWTVSFGYETIYSFVGDLSVTADAQIDFVWSYLLSGIDQSGGEWGSIMPVARSVSLQAAGTQIEFEDSVTVAGQFLPNYSNFTNECQEGHPYITLDRVEEQDPDILSGSLSTSFEATTTHTVRTNQVVANEYCTSQANSSGAPCRLTIWGQREYSFVEFADFAPGAVGILFASTDPNQFTFSTYTLCIGGANVRRVAVTSLEHTAQFNLGQGPYLGGAVYLQCIHRDPSFGVCASNAVTFIAN